MSAGWIAFEIGVNIFQFLLCLYFFKNRLQFSKTSYKADIICGVLYVSFLSLYLFYDIPIPDSVGGVIFFIYLLYASDNRWPMCALWVMFEEVLSVATIGIMLQICLSAFSVPYDLVMNPSRYRIVFVISTNFVLFVEMFFFSKIKKKSSSVHWPGLLLFAAMNITLLIVIEILFSLQIQECYSSDLPFFIAYTVLVICGMLSIVLFHLMTSITEREHQAQIALNHMQLTKDRQLAIQNMYDDMRKQRHDMRQHLQTLEQLINNQETKAAKQYLEKYKVQSSMLDSFLTGSVAVDALLTAKLLTCQRSEIEFKLSQCPLNNLPISDIDFCTILGNMLDNAIEGNLRIIDSHAHKYIHLYFSHIYDMFIIRCENPVNLATIRKEKGKFITSKENSSIHGFGIPNMISIAESAEGFCAFDIEENIFIVTVTLPYPLKEEYQYAPSGRIHRARS